MHTKRILISVLFLFIAYFLYTETRENIVSNPSEIKVALREVGHNILLANKDSTSIVLPIKQINKNKFELVFENNFAIKPDSLVAIIKNSFNKIKTTNHYLVEVIRCTDQEVAYSYKMKNGSEKSIIPCGSRTIPLACYQIQTQFLQHQKGFLNNPLTLIFISLYIIIACWFIFKKKDKAADVKNNKPQISIGKYIFYPSQNKLALKKTEIPLSRKEGELLLILALQKNQVVTRDALIKKVWEDNGVVVSRSLDTYISKLRKLLQNDANLKITNVHGVGYKLEIK